MQQPDISDRIVISGASRGIGRATALQLAETGASLVLRARDRTALAAVAAEVHSLGGRAEVVGVDLTNEDSVSRAATEVLAGGPVDVLVNNAGICHQVRFLPQDDCTALAAR